MMYKQQVPTQFPVSFRNPTTPKAVREIRKYCLRDFLGAIGNPTVNFLLSYRSEHN
jgi:hypothetical protein